jgi:hypothetical protein
MDKTDMHMARHYKLFSALTLVLVLAPANAETFRHAAHHFDFSMPGGWTRWPAATLYSANQFARQRASGHQIEFLAGFQPKGNLLGTYPYMLIQVQGHSNSSCSYEEIESGLTQATRSAARELKGALADVTRNINIGDAVLDRKNNRVIIRYELDAPNVGKVEGITMANIGKDSIVSLHYYDRTNNYDESVKTFLLIANTFEFEKEYEFKVVPASSLMAGIDLTTLSVGVATSCATAFLGVLWMARGKSKSSDWN